MMMAHFHRNRHLVAVLGILAFFGAFGLLGSIVLPDHVLQPQVCEIDSVVEVHPGDSMASIAYAHSVTLEQVRMVNGDTNPGDLQPGDYVNLPACHN